MIKISEFQSKDVINIADGKRLGRIGDLELDLVQGRVKAIVIPSGGKLFGFFQQGQEVVIPWTNIIKIGHDVILVRLEDHGYTYESPTAYETGALLYRPHGSGNSK